MRSDESEHGLRIRLGVLAQRPADRLADEELGVTGPPGAGAEEPFGVGRVKLGPGKDGVHKLEADQPVGIQVIGYGMYTSYQYPGGLNLGKISAPPIK